MSTDFYVYALCYPDGTPFYIGKGKGDRIHKHLKKRDTYNLFKNTAIHDIRKSGNEPIEQKLFEHLYEDEAFILENILIRHYGRINNETGILTNMTDGGEGCSGLKHSDETRAKLSEAAKNMSDETRAKLSEAAKNMSDETRAKLSEAKKGENNPNYGKKHSDETRAKLSEAWKKRRLKIKPDIEQYSN